MAIIDKLAESLGHAILACGLWSRVAGKEEAVSPQRSAQPTVRKAKASGVSARHDRHGR